MNRHSVAKRGCPVLLLEVPVHMLKKRAHHLLVQIIVQKASQKVLL